MQTTTIINNKEKWGWESILKFNRSDRAIPFTIHMENIMPTMKMEIFGIKHELSISRELWDE